MEENLVQTQYRSQQHPQTQRVGRKTFEIDFSNRIYPSFARDYSIISSGWMKNLKRRAFSLQPNVNIVCMRKQLITCFFLKCLKTKET